MSDPMRQTEHSGRLVTKALNAELTRLRAELAVFKTADSHLASALTECFKATQQFAGTELRDRIQAIVIDASTKAPS